jgi:DNA-binding beta-propeller fold protein YncE
LALSKFPTGPPDFDHAAFDPKTRRVFIAHTARDCIEVIDHDAQKHVATLPGSPGVVGAVADDGEILTTNRGAATITWLDAATYKIKAVFPSGPRPNGAAIVRRTGIGIAACIGDARAVLLCRKISNLLLISATAPATAE